MANNSEITSGNLSRFQIYSAENGTNSVDMSAAAVEISYYESVLSNSVSLTATIIETGFTDSKIAEDQVKPTGILDTLPLS